MKHKINFQRIVHKFKFLGISMLHRYFSVTYDIFKQPILILNLEPLSVLMLNIYIDKVKHLFFKSSLVYHCLQLPKTVKVKKKKKISKGNV